jgi:hypothetical protein
MVEKYYPESTECISPPMMKKHLALADIIWDRLSKTV